MAPKRKINNNKIHTNTIQNKCKTPESSPERERPSKKIKYAEPHNDPVSAASKNQAKEELRRPPKAMAERKDSSDSNPGTTAEPIVSSYMGWMNSLLTAKASRCVTQVLPRASGTNYSKYSCIFFFFRCGQTSHRCFSPSSPYGKRTVSGKRWLRLL
jgi:hypothetical protein